MHLSSFPPLSVIYRAVRDSRVTDVSTSFLFLVVFTDVTLPSKSKDTEAEGGVRVVGVRRGNYRL